MRWHGDVRLADMACGYVRSTLTSWSSTKNKMKPSEGFGIVASFEAPWENLRSKGVTLLFYHGPNSQLSVV